MRASPALVSAFKDARNAYADAIYAWWHASGPRERWDVPTELDYELVKLDPRVRAAERSLAAVDAQLSIEGRSVKVVTVRNDGSARRVMLEDTERIEAEWLAAQPSGGAVAGRKRRRKTAPTPDPAYFLPPEPPAAQEAPTPASTVSATNRTSPSVEVMTDHSATSPEPEDEDEGEGYKPNWRFKEPKRRRTAGS
ncbi:hypothetical protein AURDEDRAFT_115685 [Auricularia subglabra TFB-10046 SS5]|uniref:Uncharacterized protein n=1 Tax=Auricularia subglabra (strain TFB-10046 / SS5) TaxID=717982 RepID=J0LK25_AURST|nr:hypothetical protein AURDEDRAFT_115685 [Auricularia subglabra TFB-10046 SS5]